MRQWMGRLHRWLGILVSLWLVLVALTGTFLLYKTDLLQWQYPQLQLEELPSTATAGAVFDRYDTGYAYLPRADKPWVEVIDGEGNSHYHGVTGEHLLTRPALSDWIDVAVQFHHHLLLHDLGKDVMGVLSLITLFILISGIVRWWPRRWSVRLWSVRWHWPWQTGFQMTLYQFHKTFGIILLPGILLGAVTGTAIMYAATVSGSLTQLLPQQDQRWQPATTAVQAFNWNERLKAAEKIFPDMTPALVSLPIKGDGTVSMRLRYDGEWHPNGRSSLSFSTTTGELAAWSDTRNSALGYQLSQTIYPLHVAAVGGLPLFVLLLAGGIMLILLPVTGVWFWLWRQRRKTSTVRV